MKNLKHISFVFKEVEGGEKGYGGKIAAAALLNLWNQALGSNISRFSQPIKINDGILSVLASSSSWATELSFLKKDIAEKLNNAAGRYLIKDIRFKIGKLEKIIEKGIFPEHKNNDGTEDGFNIDRLKEKIENAEKERIKKGWKRCAHCGYLFFSVGKTCFFCLKNEKESRRFRIFSFLRYAPWIKMSEVKVDMPDLTDEEFIKAKKEYKMRIRTELDIMLRAFKRKKIDGSLKKAIKDTGIKFLFLDKDLSPQSFNVGMLKNVIGEKAFDAIEGVPYGKRAKIQQL